ncbi:MAG: hypothetical protein PHI32_09700 [Dysgonamonadaceae bacterium]|nr:hypothetical protein [Dysgonamonadaceae bacterium]MDD4728320.1 hypothetical protein [Dysgonamonadaceae bacterium]
MKKFLSISLTILLATLITYAGSGINAYSFCCDDCHTYGIEAIVGEGCCDIHEDECSVEQESKDNAICDNSHQQCSLDRLDIDLQDISTERNQSHISVKVLDISFTTSLHHINQNTEDELITGYISQTQKPPNLSKQTYFSLLETLII